MKINIWKGHSLVMLATFLVAGSFLASGELAGIINPFSLTLLRFLGATVILFPIVLFKREWRRKILSTIPRAIVISSFYSAFFICSFESLNTTTVLNTGTLFTLVPSITALLSILIFRETIHPDRAFAYLLGAIGTVWVVFKGQMDSLLSFSLNQGDLIFVAGVLAMCLYSISMKFLYRSDEMIVLVFCTLVGGSIWMSLAIVISDQPLQWNLIQGQLIFQMLYLSAGATLVTGYLYQKTTIILGPNRVMAYIYLNPAAVAILLLFVYEVPLQISVFPGILISIAATFMLQKNKTEAITQKPGQVSLSTNRLKNGVSDWNNYSLLIKE